MKNLQLCCRGVNVEKTKEHVLKIYGRSASAQMTPEQFGYWERQLVATKTNVFANQ